MQYWFRSQKENRIGVKARNYSGQLDQKLMKVMLTIGL